MSARGDGRRGLGDLLRDLANGSTQLIRQEVRLARLEVRQLVAHMGTGTAEVAAGGVLLLIGVMALLTGIILLVGDAWLRDRYWLAALIVTVVLGIIAAWLAGRGVALLSPAKLTPDQTVETLREDKEWLRRRLTSGATSS
jgi:VIT1/CCC1 family predicted Fe2+/Mn2+ transporter